jgi:ABC-type nickel/cobalt efflux system permease component RcnA
MKSVARCEKENKKSFLFHFVFNVGVLFCSIFFVLLFILLLGVLFVIVVVVVVITVFAG